MTVNSDRPALVIEVPSTRPLTHPLESMGSSIGKKLIIGRLFYVLDFCCAYIQYGESYRLWASDRGAAVVMLIGSSSVSDSVSLLIDSTSPVSHPQR